MNHHSGWQNDAWEYYDVIGELRFGINWISNAMSRVNLVAARPPMAAGDEPQPIDLNDEDLTPGERRAAELVSIIADGAAGQGQMLGAFGLHLSVAGIAYLVVEPSDQFSDEFANWQVYSADELRERHDGTGLELRVGDREWRSLHPNAVVLKVWRRHPRRSWEPDAPVRGVLTILNEIDLLGKHIRATAQSRLAGAGLLAIPAEAVFPDGQGSQQSQQVDPDDEDTTPPEDKFVDTLIDAMTVPLTDRGTAASVVPLVIKVPGEMVDKIRHLSFATPFDNHARELLDNAIRRLALGLDIPPEILTGTSGMNHWGAWQVAEEAITLHVEPLTETVAHALTVGFLQAALAAEGYDPMEAIVWYDTSDLRTRPDKSTVAIEAYDRVELSAEGLLRELGLSVEDAPSEEEKRERILLSVLRGAPALAPGLLAEMGLVSSTAAATMEPVEAAEVVVEAPAAPALPAQGMPEEQAAAIGLVAACDVIVKRALERAGHRLRSAAGKGQPGGAAAVQCEDATLLHTQVDAATFSDFETLLEGAWSMVPEVAARYAPGTDAADLVAALEVYTRALIASRQAHTYERLATALRPG